jgi:hypothetical protein
VYQRQAVVKANSTFLVFTFTSLEHDLGRIAELWQQTIQAIRLRQELRLLYTALWMTQQEERQILDAKASSSVH